MIAGTVYIHDRHQLAVFHERSGYVALAPRDLVLCARADEVVACLRLGRRFLGIEVDPAMAETARERLRAEERMVGVVSTRAGQGALFQ